MIGNIDHRSIKTSLNLNGPFIRITSQPFDTESVPGGYATAGVTAGTFFENISSYNVTHDFDYNTNQNVELTYSSGITVTAENPSAANGLPCEPSNESRYYSITFDTPYENSDYDVNITNMLGFAGRQILLQSPKALAPFFDDGSSTDLSFRIADKSENGFKIWFCKSYSYSPPNSNVPFIIPIDFNTYLSSFKIVTTQRTPTESSNLSFRWFFNGSEVFDTSIDPNSRASISSTQQDSVISISGLTIDDNNSEIYAIVEGNPDGNIADAINEPVLSRTANITVSPIINFLKQPIDDVSAQDDVSVFEVDAEVSFLPEGENPDISYQWQFLEYGEDGRPQYTDIVDGGNISLFKGNEGLTVTDISVGESKKYSSNIISTVSDFLPEKYYLIESNSGTDVKTILYLSGAGGGKSTERNVSGGKGGRTEAVFTFKSGKKYIAVVGKSGQNGGYGGLPGGGNGGSGYGKGGGGGGYTGLFLVDPSDYDSPLRSISQENAILIAGGGGGGNDDPSVGGDGGGLNGTYSSDYGESVYTKPGTYQWTCPDGVYSVCAVCIGGGGSGEDRDSKGAYGAGGGGGGLGWKNNIPVTPGESYTVRVGFWGVGIDNIPVDAVQFYNGGDSYFIDKSTVSGGGGGSGWRNNNGYGLGGSYTGDGGGNGGNGSSVDQYGGGGGGAGGYSGNGGDGGIDAALEPRPERHENNPGQGGGGAGGNMGQTYGGGGGGVGLYGEGSSGSGAGVMSIGEYGRAGFGAGGAGGSGGEDGKDGGVTMVSTYQGGDGGQYGGGSGGTDSESQGAGRAGHGAVRIIWGENRAFPKTNVGQSLADTNSSRNGKGGTQSSGGAGGGGPETIALPGFSSPGIYLDLLEYSSNVSLTISTSEESGIFHYVYIPGIANIPENHGSGTYTVQGGRVYGPCSAPNGNLYIGNETPVGGNRNLVVEEGGDDWNDMILSVNQGFFRRINSQPSPATGGTAGSALQGGSGGAGGGGGYYGGGGGQSYEVCCAGGSGGGGSGYVNTSLVDSHTFIDGGGSPSSYDGTFKIVFFRSIVFNSAISVIGAKEKRLQISTKNIGTSLIRCLVTTTNKLVREKSLGSDEVNFTVVAPRNIINVERYRRVSNPDEISNAQYMLTTTKTYNFDLLSSAVDITPGDDYIFVVDKLYSFYPIACFYSPEKDQTVEMELWGGAGANLNQIGSGAVSDQSLGSGQGGRGGYSKIRFNMEKNVEYIASVVNGESIFIFKKERLMAVVGGGGNANFYGAGGAGGGVKDSGGDAFGGAKGGQFLGGSNTTISTSGIFGSDAKIRNEDLHPNDSKATSNDGGRTLRCSRGTHYSNEGLFPCESIGNQVNFVDRHGNVYLDSASISRGYKDGYNIFETAGAGDDGAYGRGGYGATGGQGGRNKYGGGGGSGYYTTEVPIEILESVAGGNTNSESHKLTIKSVAPSVNEYYIDEAGRILILSCTQNSSPLNLTKTTGAVQPGTNTCIDDARWQSFIELARTYDYRLTATLDNNTSKVTNATSTNIRRMINANNITLQTSLTGWVDTNYNYKLYALAWDENDISGARGFGSDYSILSWSSEYGFGYYGQSSNSFFTPTTYNNFSANWWILPPGVPDFS